MENNQIEEKELIDKTAKRVMDMLGKNRPMQHVRKSQLLTALIGAVGFALFVDGILKFSVNLSALKSLSLGVLLMIITGLLIENLSR
jgi:hypothetical protein